MVGSALRIVYFGTPAFAVPTLRGLLASRHTVVALVSQPDRARGRGQHVTPTPTKAVALEAGVPVLQPLKLREQAFLSSIAGFEADLGVVAAYGRILPDALLGIPHLGMINVHGSLLPKYRGAAPVHRAVIAGESMTGITIMRVVTELDAGPMLATATRPIGPDDISVEVERDLAEIGARSLIEVVDRFAQRPRRRDSARRSAGDLCTETGKERKPDRLGTIGAGDSQPGAGTSTLADGIDDDWRWSNADSSDAADR